MKRFQLVAVDDDGMILPGPAVTASVCPGCWCLVLDDLVISHVTTQHAELVEQEEKRALQSMMERSAWYKP